MSYSNSSRSATGKLGRAHILAIAITGFALFIAAPVHDAYALGGGGSSTTEPDATDPGSAPANTGCSAADIPCRVGMRSNLSSQPQEAIDAIVEWIQKSQAQGTSDGDIDQLLDGLDLSYAEMDNANLGGGDYSSSFQDTNRQTQFSPSTRDKIITTVPQLCSRAPEIRSKAICAAGVTAGILARDLAAKIAKVMIDAYVQSKNQCPRAPETGGASEDEPEAVAATATDKQALLQQNSDLGRIREAAMLTALRAVYQCEDIWQERYLRDSAGIIMRNKRATLTGEGRRVDFVVVESANKAPFVTLEVTSEKAPKVQQLAKEFEIMQDGGTYVRRPKVRSNHQAEQALPSFLARF